MSSDATNPPVRALPRKVYHEHGYMLEVPQRYDICEMVGRGAYGAVFRAKDTVTGEEVAIKKVSNVFADLIDGKRIVREVRLLHYMNHPNILHLSDIFRTRKNTYIADSLAMRFADPSKPKPPPTINHNDFFADIYVVTELMSTDLAKVLKYEANDLTEEHSRYFAYQMCAGLHYIHSGGVIHRDMKPGNMLVHGDCRLKIADFGLARMVGGKNLTDYVVTRWYRPPELLLVCTEYGTSVDMWGLGALTVETLTKDPLFPGKDYINQIAIITDALGVPTDDELKHVRNKESLNYIHSLPAKPKGDLKKLMPGASDEMVDFVSKLLVYDPKKRMTAEKAMQHPWLQSLYTPEDLVAPPQQFQWDHDSTELTLDQLKDLMKEAVDSMTLEDWKSVE